MFWGMRGRGAVKRGNKLGCCGDMRIVRDMSLINNAKKSALKKSFISIIMTIIVIWPHSFFFTWDCPHGKKNE